MRLDCVQVALERAFYRYGKLVGRKPLPFLITPIVFTALIALGMIRFNLVQDVEFLYTPTNGQAKEERSTIQEHFKEEDDRFLSTRKTTLDGFVQVVVTGSSEGDNIFTEATFNVISQLESEIYSLEITHESNIYTYNDLCETWDGSCEGNTLLTDLSASNDFNQTGYPFHSTIFMPSQLGGVSVDSDGYVSSARAYLLAYYVKYSSDSDLEKADLWLEKVKVFLRDDFRGEGISVDFQTSLSLEEELTAATKAIVPYFSVAYTILFNFTVLTCLMRDWVRSKPFAAMGGELAAAFAIVTSLGLMSACGLPFASTVGVMPFLIIGIGIDDLFVIVSAWRHTDFRLSVEERMGRTLQTAAVSVTVTSITDAIAFGIGSITTFRAVTYFCAYTGVAVLFCYIYALTFFAACMVYSGKREAANRHAYTFKKILPPEMSSGSKAYMFCCTGGYVPETDKDILVNGGTATTKDNGKLIKQNGTDSTGKAPLDDKLMSNKTDNSKPETSDTKKVDSEHPQKASVPSTASTTPSSIEEDEEGMFALPWLTEFLRDKLAPFIMKTPVKIIIFFLYCIYLGFSIWGCVTLSEGLQLKNLAPDDSYLADFYSSYNDHFLSQYGARVMLAITESLDYSDQSVRENVLEEIQKFTNSSVFYSDESYSESWLAAFNSYLTQSHQSPSNMSEFISILKTQFLTIPAYQFFTLDINFSDDDSAILSSRFLLQSTGVSDSLQERTLMLESRELAENSAYPSSVVYHPAFIYYDQYTVILSNTLQNLGIAVGSMLLVSFFLLPSLVSVLFVTLSVVSICCGVIGFMSFWNINLDSVSMINLIMCIGFSVDFSAHISYHFAISKLKTGNQKAVEAIGHLGMPIVQGAISTVLGVVVLAFSNSYIFRTFFKIILLVMIFGFLHALFLLPVLLSVVPACKCCRCCTNEDEKVAPTEETSNKDKLKVSTEHLKSEKDSKTETCPAVA